MASRLQRVVATLASANADRLLYRRDENLAVTDLVGARCGDDRLDRAFNLIIRQHHFDLHLWQKIDHIFGTPIQFGMPFLTAETLYFQHRKPLHANVLQGFLDLIQLEWL